MFPKNICVSFLALGNSYKDIYAHCYLLFFNYYSLMAIPGKLIKTLSSIVEGVNVSHYGDVATEQVDAVTRRLSALRRDYPGVQLDEVKLLSDDKAIKHYDMGTDSGAMEIREAGQINAGKRVIYLNTKANESWRSNMGGSVSSGQFSAPEALATTLTHEFGHALNLNAAEAMDYSPSLIAKYMTNPLGSSAEEVGAKIGSRYAKTDDLEAFAETFAKSHEQSFQQVPGMAGVRERVREVHEGLHSSTGRRQALNSHSAGARAAEVWDDPGTQFNRR